MKVIFVILLWGAFLFLTTTGFSQHPVVHADSIPAKPKDLVPDCNRYGNAFRFFRSGEWQFNKYAGECYAEVLAHIGEAHLTPDSALAYVKASLSNPLEKGLLGYIGAVCVDEQRGRTSFDQKLTRFDGRFLCRINSQWSLYTREGCVNLDVVYDPIVPDLTPKGLDEIPQKVVDTVPALPKCGLTIQIIFSCPPAPAPVPTSTCCDVPKKQWDYFYPMIGSRSTYSSDLWSESPFLGFGYKKQWNDTLKQHSTYAGMEVTVFQKNKIGVTCDTCPELTEDDFVKPALRLEVFVGCEFGVPDQTKLRGFIEGRYTIIQPSVIPVAQGLEDRRFLPKKSGLLIKGGVRYDLFKSLELGGGAEYDPIANMFGGEVRVALHLGNKKVQKPIQM